MCPWPRSWQCCHEYLALPRPVILSCQMFCHDTPESKSQQLLHDILMPNDARKMLCPCRDSKGMMCCMEESPCEFKAEEFPQGEERREMRQITSEIRGREKGLKGDGNNPKARWYTSWDQQLRRSNGGGNGGGRQWTWQVEVLTRWDARVRGTQI